MDSSEIRRKFLEFFKKNGHTIVPSSSLLPNDPSVLFTTAGMQQFKKYYLEEYLPFGDKTTSCQKCFRTSDIEEVGDERHLTFFEMLGNFSFGGYFKEEAITYAKKFLDEVGVKIDYVTVFEGDKEMPKDKESVLIWRKLGFSEEKNNLRLASRAENFWGPTGQEGPCGPTAEIYAGSVEIWNIVFNEYFQDKNKKLTSLPKKGVDTGMGLERLAMALQKKKTVFETDLFLPLIKEIEKQSGAEYEANLRPFRIIADHIKSSVFLLGDGFLPSNVEQGYVLRRLLRRAIRFGRTLKMPPSFLIPLARIAIKIYQETYPELKREENDILAAIQQEEERFEKTLESGLRKFNEYISIYWNKKLNEKVLPGRVVFDLYQTYGFPFEITKELAEEKGLRVYIEDFERHSREHQELSRTASAGMFRGGLADASLETTKLHTAAHLMLAGLRKVLGGSVVQKGSNITAQRLRFDFSHKEKITSEQIKEVEDFVNEAIKKDLAVKSEEITLDEAKRVGAVGVFESRYGKKVNVYTIGDDKKFVSKEICGGPHVERTGALGRFKIIKEESSGAGIRRIRAVLG